jgi:hypothetical protein
VRVLPSDIWTWIGQEQEATHWWHFGQQSQYGEPPQAQQCAGMREPDPPQSEQRPSGL